MYILIFFLTMSLSLFIINKALNIDDSNVENTNYSKVDSLIILGLFVVGIVLQIIDSKDLFLYFSLGYACLTLSTMIIFSVFKKNRIEKQREEIKSVYEILQKLVDKKGEGLDYNNVPFTLKYQHGNINDIEITVDPTSFSEKELPIYLDQLNEFLPTFYWNYELHLEERHFNFVGKNKPPTMAMYPGSWLQNSKFMPIAISGEGEVAWQIDSVSKKQYGHSQFKNEYGDFIPLDKSLPAVPQGLIAGACLTLDTLIPTTKGVKAIKNIKIGDCVFDRNNQPETVIAKSLIKIPKKVYKIKLYNDKYNIVRNIKTDDEHQLPRVIYNKIEPFKVKDLVKGNFILGTNNTKWKILDITEVKLEKVMCIKVDNPEHLFCLGQDSIIYEKGLPTILSYNTGGGKAIYIDQGLWD